MESSDRLLKSAEKICLREGRRFTAKRKEIFKVMIHEKKALSAYEIADCLKASGHAAIPMMSIYRILEFLEQSSLVHRISSLNKYSLCAHIDCNHQHDLPRLAVCQRCQKVDEIPANPGIKDDLQVGLRAIQFQLSSQHIELVGLCGVCSQDTQTPYEGGEN